MKTLAVQIQPGRLGDGLGEQLRAQLEEFAESSTLVTSCTVSSGDDEGRFINVCFSARSLTAVWRELERSFLRMASIAEPSRRRPL